MTIVDPVVRITPSQDPNRRWTEQELRSLSNDEIYNEMIRRGYQTQKGLVKNGLIRRFLEQQR